MYRLLEKEAVEVEYLSDEEIEERKAFSSNEIIHHHDEVKTCTKIALIFHHYFFLFFKFALKRLDLHYIVLNCPYLILH